MTGTPDVGLCVGIVFRRYVGMSANIGNGVVGESGGGLAATSNPTRGQLYPLGRN